MSRAFGLWSRVKTQSLGTTRLDLLASLSIMRVAAQRAFLGSGNLKGAVDTGAGTELGVPRRLRLAWPQLPLTCP